MNRCFIVGKVINNPEFDFLYMEKRISISYFCLKLNDDNIIKIFGYDENADYIYRNIKKGKKVIIEGMIRNENRKMEVEIKKIEKWHNSNN